MDGNATSGETMLSPPHLDSNKSQTTWPTTTDSPSTTNPAQNTLETENTNGTPAGLNQEPGYQEPNGLDLQNTSTPGLPTDLT